MVGSRITCCGSANKEEGILDILTDAGLYYVNRMFRLLAMNDDKVPAGKYSVSTSNRNFEASGWFKNVIS
jgi:homoaconitase/3-isopropylmalate dehydratase large subunit